jgi:ketosteroid isomerase-like protein
MATADPDFIRRAYDAWNRRDLELIRAILDPEVEIDATQRIMNPDVYHGHEGFQRLMEEVADVWEQWRIEPEEFIDCDDRMVVAAHAYGRGRASGVELDQTAYNVWKLRDGKVVRLAFYPDRDTAMRDAQEEAQSATRPA